MNAALMRSVKKKNLGKKKGKKGLQFFRNAWVHKL